MTERLPPLFCIIMSSNTQTSLLFLFLFLLALPLETFSWNSQDLPNWEPCNSQDYDRKAASGLECNNWWEDLDPELRKAEMNKIIRVVSQNGDGDFTSISDAIDSIPKKNDRRVVLRIKPGVYREKITIWKSKHFITFSGDPEDPPLITWNATAVDVGDDGKPLRTLNSATVAIKPDYFIASNIKFQNTASHTRENATIQAVAVRVSGNKAAFYNCSFYGYQDTLYDHKGIHYFNNCFIQGTVDFICGYGRSLYEHCHLHYIGERVSALTAQARSNTSVDSGYSFTNCRITAVGSGKIYLGRPWREYSRVVFSYTFMDSCIMPQGWGDWNDPKRHSTVFYGEYQCSGPGADTSRRVPWSRSLTDKEAKPFLGKDFIQGKKWLLPHH